MKKWYLFDKFKGSRQKYLPERKWVVVLLEKTKRGTIPALNLPCGLGIGYKKNGAGDPQSPYFVVPGIGGEVLAWCDCLPDDFEYPIAITKELGREQ
ncbi:MAG: hypothetical protein NWE89_12310 [Candidatus Bathyarchaeota archaeon]|nr:hypothetical protein [Candidatus Bathyarchaeota archaeon]